MPDPDVPDPDVPDPDVVVVGGGHNGLVAAAYLAGAGLRVVVVEAREVFGGAVASGRPFPGVDVSVSRFAYLMSLLPDELIADLELPLELRSRRNASYTPTGTRGLLIERPPGPATRESFRRLTGSDHAYAAWEALQHDLTGVADVVAPTPAATRPAGRDVAAVLPAEIWSALTRRPLAELLESRIADDTVRGMLLTDALIGTYARAEEPDLRQNRTFLYHVLGNRTGEWRVPVGGMGAVADALQEAARRRGACLRAGTPVSRIEPQHPSGARVHLADGTVLEAPYVLAGCSPTILARLRGTPSRTPEGSQLKVNLVLRRLPRLRSGLDPATAFAGTLHLGQGYRRLAQAYDEAAAGQIPDPLPCETYCHTLTDASILGARARDAGHHTLTLFGLHAPARLFVAEPEAARDRATAAAMHALQAALAEPLEACLAVDAAGRPCVETMTPLDLEAELGLPGGHIFHGDLAWPWWSGSHPPVDPASRWGVATDHPGLLLAGAGALRGGAVSGIGGHNAAMAVLMELGYR